MGVGRHHPRLRAADPTSIAVDFGRRTDNAVGLTEKSKSIPWCSPHTFFSVSLLLNPNFAGVWQAQTRRSKGATRAFSGSRHLPPCRNRPRLVLLHSQVGFFHLSQAQLVAPFYCRSLSFYFVNVISKGRISFLHLNVSACPAFSPVHGSLIEVNEALVQEPQRLLEAPYAEGYVAILSVSSDRRAQALAAGIPDEVAYDGAAAAASIDFSTLHSTSAPGTDNNDGSDAADSDTEEGTAEAAAPMVDEGHAEGEGKLTTRRAEEDLEGGPPGKLAHYNQASDNSSSGKR